MENSLKGFSKNPKVLSNFPVFLKSVEKATTKTGAPFIKGVLHNQDDIFFNIWSNSLAFGKLDWVNSVGKVLVINAEPNEYNGIVSLIINDVAPAPETIQVSSLIGTPLDLEKNYNALLARLQRVLSDKAYKVWETIMGTHLEDFKQEFAATYYHDNVKGGLLFHTLKILVFLETSMQLYSSIRNSTELDLIYLGTVLHDLGKIREYSMGSRTNIAFTTHEVLGALMVSEHKDLIIQEFNEEFYYRLLSIITQHHGEFGIRPNTVEAYVVHLIDMFESKMQFLNQSLTDNDDTILRIDDFKLQ